MSSSQDHQLQVDPEITVLGVMHDPELSLAVKIQPGNVVDHIVQEFIKNLLQSVNVDLGLPGPSGPDIVVQVFVEAGALTDAATATFASLKPPQSPQHYLVMLGAKDWSYVRELNKELTKHKQMSLSTTPSSPTFEDPITTLRAELGGRLDSLQASNVTLQHTNESLQHTNESLRSLNTRLVQKITSLESSVTDLNSSNNKLKMKITSLESSVADLNSSNNKLKMKMATNDNEWKVWSDKMEKKRKVENEILMTTCSTLREKNATLTKDFETQVAWQAKVEEDLSLLDAVVLRNLVDKAQESLAEIARLHINPHIRPSVVWRAQFPDGMSTEARIREAISLFAGRDDVRAKAAIQVLQSGGGVLLVEEESHIRRDGDSAAHGSLSHPGVSPAVMRQPEEKRAAILSVVSFLCDP